MKKLSAKSPHKGDVNSFARELTIRLLCSGMNGSKGAYRIFDMRRMKEKCAAEEGGDQKQGAIVGVQPFFREKFRKRVVMVRREGLKEKSGADRLE